MISAMQETSPVDSDFSFSTLDYQRSSFSSNRSSISTVASSFSPGAKLIAEAGGLATPTTPSAFQQPPRMNTLHPLQPGAMPPSPPQLQPLSTLAMFAGELFVWLWFAPPNDASQGSFKASKQQLAPSERFLRFCHDVLSTSELSPAEIDPFARSSRGLRKAEPAVLIPFLCTAQVSHSVVILGLLFVSRLKAKNHIHGSPGSEFRASVTA